MRTEHLIDPIEAAWAALILRLVALHAWGDLLTERQGQALAGANRGVPRPLLADVLGVSESRLDVLIREARRRVAADVERLAS